MAKYVDPAVFTKEDEGGYYGAGTVIEQKENPTISIIVGFSFCFLICLKLTF